MNDRSLGTRNCEPDGASTICGGSAATVKVTKADWLASSVLLPVNAATVSATVYEPGWSL